MKHRHLLIVAALLFVVWIALSARTIELAGFYQTDQIRSGTILAAVCIGAWTLLEIADRTAGLLTHRCRCGYDLRGMKCPECGRPLGTPTRHND